MNRALGDIGENQAVAYLKRSHWKVIERNFFARVGEIDIIAKDPEGVLVFIEVKSYSVSDYTHPLEAITPEKQRKWWKAAEYYCYRKRLDTSTCRFDVITVDRQTESLAHLRNVLSG